MNTSTTGPGRADRRLAALQLAALALTLAGAFAAALLLIGHDADAVRRTVDGAGAWAPVAFVALMTVLTCAFLPFPAMAAAGGILFGTAEGTLYAVAGGTLGACAAFLAARRFGAGPVAALAPDRLLRLLDAVGRRGFSAVLLLRTVPGVPRDLANYLCGVTPVGLAPYVAATLIGITPRAYAYTALGGELGDLGSTESVVAVATLAAMALLGLVLLARARPSSRP